MSGPFFVVIASLADTGTPTGFQTEATRIAAAHGYGTEMGLDEFEKFDPEAARVLEALSRGVPRHVTFSVTSRPDMEDALDIFEGQLNPWNDNDPTKADFLIFLRELWSLEVVREALFVILDRGLPSAEAPRHSMSLEQFLRHLETYYVNSLREAEFGSVEGVFEVRKQD